MRSGRGYVLLTEPGQAYLGKEFYHCDYTAPVFLFVKSTLLVGFSRECAPLRCAHPSFLGLLTCQTGRCAPPPRA